MVVDDTSKIAVAIDPADPEAIKVHKLLRVRLYNDVNVCGVYSEVCSRKEYFTEGSSYNSQALVRKSGGVIAIYV